ncbi:AAA family ATPase [Acinetobacter sp. A3.8]|uniref:AAA family ATPase n=1 Tax=Acinetobacter sedimenti TaxID=2919922 RepID=A0A9X1WYN3_9GAMM|nr:AAA family ATPase [Acinetobacter sedimenti]MCJ8147003.1 AAA family ATPase [Acinetobacter sedimenti]
MYLKNIKLWNFRKYGSDTAIDLVQPNLNLNFVQGLNVLIGENDSGKTAIIDAIKLVLKTHSYEYLKVEDRDFYKDSTRFRIELEFHDLTDEEAKNFIEWLGWTENGEKVTPYLKLNYDVTRTDKKVLPSDIKAGTDSDGSQLSAEARDYLKTTYLKPLRDAENELIAKKNSRLSQILLADPAFKDKNKDHELVKMFEALNENLTKYFKGEEIQYTAKDGNPIKDKYEAGKIIKDKIDGYIQAFYGEGMSTEFNVSATELKGILEKFSLFLESQRNVGLGTLNRLFMATELLHLNKENWFGLRLGLVEELEAHLHPQAQMQVIEALMKQDKIQLILSTHSPNLASKVKLEHLILCHNNTAFPLGQDYTQLDQKQYVFLEKFLDTTKSNLFFAKGVIFVEGWAEEILIPSFAKAIGIDLTAKGISVVNIGNVGFPHYVNIFLRKSPPHMTIPIAVITDSDIRTYEKVKTKVKSKDGEKEEEEVQINYQKRDVTTVEKETAEKLTEIKSRAIENVQYFPAPQWTLEWCLFKSTKLSKLFQAETTVIHPTIFSRTDFELNLATQLIKKGLGKTEIAYQLAHALDDEMNQDISKQTLKLANADKDDAIYYLIEAIKYVANH